MAKVVRLGEERNRRLGPVCFTRPELNRLLSLYGQRVAQGDWRDYAIRLGPGMAAFTIYKSALDRPLYTIAKFRRGALGGADQFLVSQGGSRLKQGATLDEVLVPIEPRLRLVSGKS
jgi:hypothetical protein